MSSWKEMIHKIDDNRWEIRRSYREGMQVPGLIYASENMLSQIWEDHALQQVVNVSFLPGIVGSSLAMPDIHWGYGFPIGGVAAFNYETGIISPGGVGYDIN
jgi:tRNA-splicing ligase RtcB